MKRKKHKINISVIIPIGKDDKKKEQETVHMLKNQSHEPFEIITVYEGNIAHARNLGVQKAKCEYILQCDCGTIYPSDYVEKMCEGFKHSGFVTGSWHLYGNKYHNFYVRNNTGSTRCIGYTRKLFNEVGGYQESLNQGEDTEFNIAAERIVGKPYLTDAICFWKARENNKKLARQFFLYGKGDKKAGNVRKFVYFLPLIAIGEWLIHSCKLLKVIWTYRINYWNGVLFSK